MLESQSTKIGQVYTDDSPALLSFSSSCLFSINHTLISVNLNSLCPKLKHPGRLGSRLQVGPHLAVPKANKTDVLTLSNPSHENSFNDNT